MALVHGVKPTATGMRSVAASAHMLNAHRTIPIFRPTTACEMVASMAARLRASREARHSGRSGQSSYGDRQYRGKRASYGERPWRGESSSFEDRQHQEDAEQGFESREPRQRGGRSFERGASSSEFGRKPYRGGSSQRSNRNDGGRGAVRRLSLRTTCVSTTSAFRARRRYISY